MTTGARYLVLVSTTDGGLISFGPWYTKPKAEEGMATISERCKELGDSRTVTLVKILAEHRLGASP